MSLLLLSLAAFAGDVKTEAPAESGEATPEVAEEPTGPDRSKPPQVKPPVPLDLDDLTRHEIRPGFEVWHVRIPRLKDVSIELGLWQGSVDITGGPTPVTRMLSATWDIASEKYDSNQLSELEDLYDMMVVASLYSHSASVSVDAPKKELDRAFELLADVFYKPTFPPREIKLNKEDKKRYYDVIGPASPEAVAGGALTFAWNPADHPYGIRPNPEGYQSVKQAELVALHQQVISQGPATLLVVGDVGWEEVEPLVAKYLPKVGKEGERSEHLDAPMPDRDRVIAVDVSGGEQALIRMRSPAPARDHEDRPALSACAYALGGHFLARLNKNLREDKGWTYGVGFRYSPGRKRGSVQVSVDVPVDKFEGAVGELTKELDQLASDGVTEGELDASWRASVTGFNRIRGTIDDSYYFYEDRLDKLENVADRVAWLEATRDVTVEQSVEAAKRWLSDESTRVWVVAGPRTQLEPQLENLGWDVEWLTPAQALLGDFEGGPIAAE